MDSNDIYIMRLKPYELEKVVAWYDQADNSWLYCDCPLDLDYSHAYDNIHSHLYKTFDDLDDSYSINYYSILKAEKDGSRQIGFAIIRKNFDYFNNISGYSIGIDIPEKNDRYHGMGTIAIRRFLQDLQTYKNIGLNSIYIETLSYNKPMQKIAERLGFELIEKKELGEEYQKGFAKHIYEIADCLNTEIETLQEVKVEALLYRIDFDNWSNV